MGLKELTKEVHQDAERQGFVKVLMSGQMNEELYAEFLYNQHAIYNLLEACAMSHGLLNDFPQIRRAPSILADFQELWKKEDMPELAPSTEKYIQHMATIKEDPKKLMAHIYVRHMGDLSGGQMIAKRVPGSGTMYKFENGEELKNKIRSKLNDTMGDEANVAFDFAISLMKDMNELKK